MGRGRAGASTAVVCASMLCALMTPVASAAPTRVKTIPSSVVIVTQDFSTETQAVCNSTAFVQFPDIKGAGTYTASWFDANPRVNTKGLRTGPPFQDGAAGYITTPAPKGSHRFGLSAASGSTCNLGFYSNRFKNVKVTVTLPADKVLLSGTVVRRGCQEGTPSEDGLTPCIPDARPVAGQSVTASGPKGSFRATTAASGTYRFLVPKGSYSVKLAGASGSVKPTSHKVSASGDVGGLDFQVCKAEKGFKGPKACGLVLVTGTVVDVAGARFLGIEVSTGDDSAISDGNGRFEVWAAPGRRTFKVTGQRNGNIRTFPTGSTTVKVVEGLTGVRVKALPGMRVIAGLTPYLVIGGLPIGPTPEAYTVVLERRPPGPADCRSSLLVEVPDRGFLFREIGPGGAANTFTRWCTGSYTATLREATAAPSAAPAASTTFSIGG